MTVVKELIRSELDGTLSFGDYTLDRMECSYMNLFRELQ